MSKPLPQVEQSSCVLCELPMRHCWQFQDDDCGCSLCGKRILTLHVGQGHASEEKGVTGSSRAVPGKDGRLWLYLPPGGNLYLCLAWTRGVGGKPQDRLAPVLDLERCQAVFNGQLGSVKFQWHDLTPRETNAAKSVPLAVVGLKPESPTALPATGLGGMVCVVTPPLKEDYRAVLWPWPDFACTCTERGLADPAGVLQVNQAQRVPLEMALSVKAPVWVLGCEVDAPEAGERIELAGLGATIMLPAQGSHTFDQPIRVNPDAPLPFRVAIDSSRWQPQKPYRLALTFHLHGLPSVRCEQRLALLQGSRLDFVGGNFRNVPPVQLGQVETVGFALTVPAEQGNAESIRIVHCRVFSNPSAKEAGSDWLRVEHPAPGTQLDVKPGKEVSLKVALDTRGLDRDHYDQRALSGEVRLTDSRRREWTCYVQTVARRPVRMDRAVAFDWGTTNTVAAVHEGDEAVPLPLDDAQRDDPERFPSDIYFLDLRNPLDPQIEIGHRAALGSHPECHVRSLKRTFQFFKHIHVTDEQGIRHTYEVEQLATLFLQRLVFEAERMSGQEISEVGLTFPTKWPPSVRHRLDQVRQELEKRLHSTHVTVHEPRIDEANAVAIHLLASRWIEGKKDLNEKFYLVAYDFGGGTVDTCVLEVVRAGNDVKTRYIGVGGREDFGGDDATRAVMQMLRKRLTAALQKHEVEITLPGGRKVKARLKEVPLVPYHVSLEGTGADAAFRAQRGQANWETLWRIAEAVKSLPRGDEATGGSNLYVRLAEKNDQIHCSVLAAGAPPQEETVTLDKILAGCSEQVIQQISRDLSFPLGDAWKEPLEDLHHSRGGREFTVAGRVKDTIAELKWQCERAGVMPSVVVLAGGGSRLGLVKEQVQEAFQLASEDYLIADATDAKRRVAYGLASYLDNKRYGDFGEGLARSVDILHHVVGVCERREEGRLRPMFARILDVGTPIHDNRWYPFEFQAGQLRTGRSGRELGLFAQLWQEGERLLEIGSFALEQAEAPEAAEERLLTGPLPKGISGKLRGQLRLLGANRIELCVLVGEQRYGLYRLRPNRQGMNLEDLLQGPARVAGGRK